jgi:hypothetical protein
VTVLRFATLLNILTHVITFLSEVLYECVTNRPNPTVQMLDSNALLEVALILSYFPLGMYVESFRFNSALISAIGSSLAIPGPITGCVKDLSRIWHLSPSDVLTEFRPYGRTSVASLRHGNTFPLVNKAFLERASIIGRRPAHEDSDDTELHPRIVRVNVTFILPTTPQSKFPYAAILSQSIIVVEALGLIALAIWVFISGLTFGAILLLCLAVNTVLLLILQRSASLIFASKVPVDKDASLTAARGAALDAHTVVEDWNASDMDVLVGYSSQLHALTNMHIRIKRWKAVVWVSRMMSLVLVLQASMLASILGTRTTQVWGSVIWLACYSLMQVPSFLISAKNPDMLFEGQPAKVTRLPSINFIGRKAALIFIAALPGIKQRFGVGRWDWMDPFMPNNQRRKEWLEEITAGGLEMDPESIESASTLSKESKMILAQVNGARKSNDFKSAIEEFMKAVGLDQAELQQLEPRSGT